MFFDKALFYFLYENNFIIITFVLQSVDKKQKFLLHKTKIIKWITVVVQNIDLLHRYES